MIIKLILLLGCCLMLTLALGQACVRQKSPSNIILICLATVCAIWSARYVLHAFNLLHHVPHAIRVQLPFICLTGPLWYLYVKCLLTNYQPSRKTLLHTIPAIICFLLAIPFYLESTEFKLAYKETHIHGWTNISVYIANNIAGFSCIIYSAMSSFFLLSTIKRKTHVAFDKSTIQLLLLITSTSLLAALLRLFGFLLNSQMLSLTIPATIISFGFALLYCLSQRKPSVVGLNFIEKKKPKSINCAKELHKSDASLINCYQQLIREQQLYLNPSITIAQLAKKLRIQPHRLSELINNTTNSNFKYFINSFRVEHAKKLLIENPSLSIIDIAYASGFNSKSVFYNSFTKTTTLTPSDFRKDNTPYHCLSNINKNGIPNPI